MAYVAGNKHEGTYLCESSRVMNDHCMCASARRGV